MVRCLITIRAVTPYFVVVQVNAEVSLFAVFHAQVAAIESQIVGLHTPTRCVLAVVAGTAAQIDITHTVGAIFLQTVVFAGLE